MELLSAKKNIRVLIVEPAVRGGIELRGIDGGLLIQQRDTVDAAHDRPNGWELACGEPVDAATLTDLEFAWRACRSVKSNAILLARDGASVGVGMGQVNRVDASRLAVERAGERARGAVAASDAFFPFSDGLEILLRAECGPWSSREGPVATRRSSRRPGGPGSPCTSPVPGTSTTDRYQPVGPRTAARPT